jgi:glucose uptake protein GlcU
MDPLDDPSDPSDPEPVPARQKSWYSRIVGRSFLSVLVGHGFFADKNNAASLIAIMLVATLCFVVAFRQQYEYVNGLLNIVFVVIGYYFGSKREKAKGDDDDDSATQI